MKRFTCLILLAICIVLFVGACKKTGIDSPIVGKWWLVAEYISPGGPGVWTNVQNENKYVQFNDNGLLRSNIFQDYASYAIKDSITLTITNDDSAPGYYTRYASKIYNYRYRIKRDSLTISPPCIEGCAMKFVKQN